MVLFRQWAIEIALTGHGSLNWTEALTETETTDELQQLFEQSRPSMDRSDRHKWIPNTAGVFSVKSTYTYLQNNIEMEDLETATVTALKTLWRNNVPSKVSIFSWRAVAR
ncbi:hypothetical protein L195_g040582 [Trifolium pratense]|uniref:Reverse transcriptase zinc-binding domain-containing protein n=1 Tax=Trifolium pratense TaxID=57577 RepID=A0A2K3M156_TRIPR|nr:hypothetical protein L195_g040582 [Trifolium pratense]